MAVPKYLEENKENISNSTQNSETWKSKYSSFNNDSYPLIKCVYDEFNCRPLLRTSIIDLYKKDENLKLALTATLMWGLIDSRGTSNYLKEIIDYKNIDSNLKKLQAVKKLLQHNKLEDAYKSMAPKKENNIKGIDYPYFTKILYFLGQPIEELQVKPLIFDKWSALNYLALLLNLGDVKSINKAKKLYKGISINFDLRAPGNALIKSNKPSWNMYNSFISDYDLWAKELKVTSSQIEEFTFGFELKNNKKNPRKDLWKFIIDGYTKLISNNS